MSKHTVCCVSDNHIDRIRYGKRHPEAAYAIPKGTYAEPCIIVPGVPMPVTAEELDSADKVAADRADERCRRASEAAGAETTLCCWAELHAQRTRRAPREYRNRHTSDTTLNT